MTTPKGSLPPPVLKDIEKQLDNPDIRRVVFYFDSKSEHENAVIEDICRLLVSYSDLEAKIFRRKNILFLQSPKEDDPLCMNSRSTRIPFIWRQKKILYTMSQEAFGFMTAWA